MAESGIIILLHRNNVSGLYKNPRYEPTPTQILRDNGSQQEVSDSLFARI